MCERCPQWNAPIDPFRIFGNTYYVGTAGLSSVLITSGGQTGVRPGSDQGQTTWLSLGGLTPG